MVKLILVAGINKLSKDLNKSFNEVKDFRPTLKLIGAYMQSSIDKNFKAGGRPKKWKPLSPATARYKRKHGYSSLPLTRTGYLKRSISFETSKTQVVVGTNVEYAEKHDRGFGIIPQREFLMFQKQDIDAINRYFEKHIEDSLK